MSCSVADIVVALIGKGGATEWRDADARAQLVASVIEIVQGIEEGLDAMALPDFFKVQPGTAKTIKNSGGDAAITFAPSGTGLANGAFRQSATLDLGANWSRLWRIDTDFELAATPTAGNAINLYGSFSNATGAGAGNTSGSDAAYTGYSSNAAAAVKQLEFLGSHICTTQATTTVQKARPGVFMPKGRYLNIVVENASGAAFHTTDTNQVITLTPLEEAVYDLITGV